MAIQNPFGSIANPQNPMGIKTVAKPQGLGLIQSLAQKQQTPQTTQQTQPIGVKASSPMLNIKPAPQTLPQTFQQKQSAPVVAASTQDGQTAQNIDTNYQMKPGETNDQYNTRINAYNASKAPATSTPIQGTQNTQPTGFTPNTGLYGQLLTTLANKSMQPSDQYTQAIQKAQDINAQIEASKAGAAQQIAGIEATPIPLEFQQGRGQIVTQQALAQQQALANQLAGQTALAGQGIQQQQLQQQGLGTALGAAAPVQVPYSAQFVTPFSGQQVGGGQMTGSLQDAVQNVVQKLQAGQMTYNDATQALAGYGQGGINALQQALPAGFNIAQSNTLAGQQGSIKPAYDFAKSALTTLQSTINQLGELQGTNIPALNSIGNWVSTQFGLNSDKTRQYTQAVQEARAAYSQLLAAGGATPTAADSRAAAAIPDNATPNDIQAAINSLESLGQSKVNIYGNPGSSSNNTSTSGKGLYSF